MHRGEDSVLSHAAHFSTNFLVAIDLKEEAQEEQKKERERRRRRCRTTQHHPPQSRASLLCLPLLFSLVATQPKQAEAKKESPRIQRASRPKSNQTDQRSPPVYRNTQRCPPIHLPRLHTDLQCTYRSKHQRRSEERIRSCIDTEEDIDRGQFFASSDEEEEANARRLLRKEADPCVGMKMYVYGTMKSIHLELLSLLTGKVIVCRKSLLPILLLPSRFLGRSPSFSVACHQGCASEWKALVHNALPP